MNGQAGGHGDPRREIWRRGSTDYEVFRLGSNEPEASSKGVPSGSPANLPWRVITDSAESSPARGVTREEGKEGEEVEQGGTETKEVRASPTRCIVEDGYWSDDVPPATTSTASALITSNSNSNSSSSSGSSNSNRSSNNGGKVALKPAAGRPRGVPKSPLANVGSLEAESRPNSGDIYSVLRDPPGEVSSVASSRQTMAGFAEPDVGPTSQAAEAEGHRESEGDGEESEMQRLRAKRQQERLASANLGAVAGRSCLKQAEAPSAGLSDGALSRLKAMEAPSAGLSDGGPAPANSEGRADCGTRAEASGTWPSRSIRDLFPSKDKSREHGCDGVAQASARAVPGPAVVARRKKEIEWKGIMRIASATAAEALCGMSFKEKDPGDVFRDFAGKDTDVPIIRSTRKGAGTDSPTCGGGAKVRKPVLGGLRSLMKRSNSETRQIQTEEEVSSDYAAALALASRKVERELLKSVRPGQMPISMPNSGPLPSSSGAADGATEQGEASPARRPVPGAEEEKGNKDADSSVEVEDLVHLVEVGDRQVDNLLEGFSAILVREEEEAASRSGSAEVLPPLPLLDSLMLDDEELPERQSMIVDGMGRRLLQGPMAHPHPRRKHGRSSHVFC